jgi:hypothetical protein
VRARRLRIERARWAAAIDGDADAASVLRRRRNAVQFDTLPAQVDVDQFRNTVASFFKARELVTP